MELSYFMGVYLVGANIGIYPTKILPKLIVPLASIEYGFGYIIRRSPYTPYSTRLRETILRAYPGRVRGWGSIGGARGDCGVEDKG